MALSMVVFGSIGIMVRYIALPSPVIAVFRSAIGSVFLIIVILLRHKKPNFKVIKRNLLWLCISGIAIGFNWILLFEAYNYTTVATATLCYYFEPIIVILASAAIFKEKLTARSIVCVIIALIGMAFVSGVFSQSQGGASELTGIILGVGAAVLYSCVVLINKKTAEVGAWEKTTVQLLSAAVVMAVYSLILVDTKSIDLMAGTEMPGFGFKGAVLVLLLIVGVVHTGLTYALYFMSIGKLEAKSVAIMSYIDPVVAVILSAVILKETLNIWTVIGAVCIIGAALFSELKKV